MQSGGPCGANHVSQPSGQEARTAEARLYNPDFGYIIHTAPIEDEDKHYYIWHVQILPRLALQAGFELGSGMHINVALPEETAAFMRALET